MHAGGCRGRVLRFMRGSSALEFATIHGSVQPKRSRVNRLYKYLLNDNRMMHEGCISAEKKEPSGEPSARSCLRAPTLLVGRSRLGSSFPPLPALPGRRRRSKPAPPSCPPALLRAARCSVSPALLLSAVAGPTEMSSSALPATTAMDSEEERAQEQEQEQEQSTQAHADSAATASTAAGTARMDWMLPPGDAHSAMDSMSLTTLSLNPPPTHAAPRPARPPRASRPRSVTFADGAKSAAAAGDLRDDDPLQLSSPPAHSEHPEPQLPSLLPMPAIAASVSASASTAMDGGSDDSSPILSLDSTENRDGASAKLMRSSSQLNAASALVASVAHAAADAAAAASAALDPQPQPLHSLPKQRRTGSRPTKPEVARMLKKLHAEHALQSEILESQPTESDSSDVELPDVAMARRRSVSFAPELVQVSFFRSDEESHRLHLTANSGASSSSSSSSAAAASLESSSDEEELGTAALLMDDELLLFPKPSPSVESATAEESPPAASSLSSRNLRYSPPPPARAGSPSPSPTTAAAAAAAGVPVPVLRSILKKRRNAEMDVSSPPASPCAAQKTASANALVLQADLAASALAEQQHALMQQTLLQQDQPQPPPSCEKRQRRGHHIVALAEDRMVYPMSAALAQFGSFAFDFRPAFSIAPAANAEASQPQMPPAADLSMSAALRSLVYPQSLVGSQQRSQGSEAASGPSPSGACFSGFETVPAQSGFSASSVAAAAAPSTPSTASSQWGALPSMFTRAPMEPAFSSSSSAPTAFPATLAPALDERKDSALSYPPLSAPLSASAPLAVLSSSDSSSDAMVSSSTPPSDVAAQLPPQQQCWNGDLTGSPPVISQSS